MNNAPAFPTTTEHGFNSGEPGMTLRDYFAAKAMQVKFSAAGTSIGLDDHAKLCYQMADAMMKARGS
jgi:hypothetical protein